MVEKSKVANLSGLQEEKGLNGQTLKRDKLTKGAVNMIGIHGLEMPKGCFYCPFLHHDDDNKPYCFVKPPMFVDDLKLSNIVEYGTKPNWCPLVEIK